MIIDGLLLLSSAQNIATGATNASTNILDMVNARDMGQGAGQELYLACTVTTAFATTDSATLTIQLQGSTDASTWTTYAESKAYTAAELVAGARLFPIALPPRGPSDALPRYYRLNYGVGSLHFSPGAVTSMFVLDRQDLTAYPPGIGISN